MAGDVGMRLLIILINGKGMHKIKYLPYLTLLYFSILKLQARNQNTNPNYRVLGWV